MKGMVIIMKKNFAYAAAASLLLFCTACAKRADTEEINPPEVLPVEQPEQTAENTSTPEAGQSFHVTIEYETEDNSEKAEDGTEIYTSSLSYPVVTIEGNEAAAEKINADIQNRIDSFRTNTTTLDYAKEDYNFRLTDENNDFPFMPYAEDLWFGTARSDSNVISFVEEIYSFSGGAHGNTGHTGINYDTRTGGIISFEELSDDAVGFHDATLAYLQMLAETEEYQERMFDMESGLGGDLESVLYAPDKWYFSADGLTFISDPYELGPYAAGTIEFVIPYSELESMGLKPEYSIP